MSDELTLETLQARVEALEAVNGLLLEMVHQMVNDYHAPKVHWERRMIPVWKAHIEKKRKNGDYMGALKAIEQESVKQG